MREEQPMDYAVDLSKTLWAHHVRAATEMEKLKAALAESMPIWLVKLHKMLSLKLGSF